MYNHGCSIYLKPLYAEVLGKEYNSEILENRLLMQYIVYLCTTMGAPIGSYGFRYSNSHGPISSSLCDDMTNDKVLSYVNPPFNGFSDDVKIVIKNVKRLIAAGKKTKYSTKEWLECLCSIIHLKKFVLSSIKTDVNELFETLKKHQPHLNDKKANEMAYELVKSL